jgi:hypothetical protein
LNQTVLKMYKFTSQEYIFGSWNFMTNFMDVCQQNTLSTNRK